MYSGTNSSVFLSAHLIESNLSIADLTTRFDVLMNWFVSVSFAQFMGRKLAGSAVYKVVQRATMNCKLVLWLKPGLKWPPRSGQV